MISVSAKVDYAQGYFIAKPEALTKTADAAPAAMDSA
jgi:EAL domain-containing protein (putative c-di-GMP-specific phosphodiesterase class I)